MATTTNNSSNSICGFAGMSEYTHKAISRAGGRAQGKGESENPANNRTKARHTGQEGGLK